MQKNSVRFFANEGRKFTTVCEVIEKDEEKVRSRSKLSTLAGLVLDGQLSAKEAAAKASVSVSYFESYKQGFVEGQHLLAKTILLLRNGHTEKELLDQDIDKHTIDLAMTLK